MSQSMYMQPVDLQASNERLFVERHLDGYIKQAMRDNPDMVHKIERGVELLNQWLSQSHYDSKAKRLEGLRSLDLEILVVQIFTKIAYCQIPETFVSVTAQLAGHLGFDDREASIKTVAEMVAVLCYTDAFDITKESDLSSMMIQSKIPLPKEIMDAAARARYPLPMVCEPRTVDTNFQSPYLTFNDSQILGKGNSHSGDICLDVINLQNSIPLKLCTDFLTTVEEEPTRPLESADQLQLWSQFKQQSYHTYWMLVKQGNRFHITNKVDKRGRLYAQGYHVSPQGASFKKSMLEFADEELVTGV